MLYSMRMRWGFTVIELVVVMVIMAILLLLAGLTISSSRERSRDVERAADVENLGRGLESSYTQGPLNSAVTTVPSYVTAGSYPGTNEMKHIIGQTVSGFAPTQVTDGYGPTALPGTTAESFSPPTATGAYGGFVISSCAAIENTTCLNANVTSGTYFYEPITKDGTLCTLGDCVRFNLYWQREQGDTTRQVFRSKHQ